MAAIFWNETRKEAEFQWAYGHARYIGQSTNLLKDDPGGVESYAHWFAKKWLNFLEQPDNGQLTSHEQFIEEWRTDMNKYDQGASSDARD